MRSTHLSDMLSYPRLELAVIFVVAQRAGYLQHLIEAMASGPATSESQRLGRHYYQTVMRCA